MRGPTGKSGIIHVYNFSGKVVYDFQTVYQNTKREFCALS